MKIKLPQERFRLYALFIASIMAISSFFLLGATLYFVGGLEIHF